MQTAEQIRPYKTFAESVLAELERDRQQPWAAGAEAAGLLGEVEEAARKVIERASAPVKIGVVGEFSSGKTLLLGSLIGYADGLPVSETPSTGNVTALRFVPQPGSQPT